MKNLFFIMHLILGAAVPAAAGDVGGETEVGTNLLGGIFVSQYIFYDIVDPGSRDGNLMARYFFVNNTLHRAEFAIGPTFKPRGTVVKLQFGFAKGANREEDLMAAVTFIAKPRGRETVYIADAKFDIAAEAADRPNSLYQKLFVALDKQGRFQFRAEHLLVDRSTGFLRIGGEYRRTIGKNDHVFVALFYDPVVNSPGIQVGFRFF